MNQEYAKKLPPDRLWQPTTAKWFFAVFGASLIYSIIRYHIAGDVSWAHFPLFLKKKLEHEKHLRKSESEESE